MTAIHSLAPSEQRVLDLIRSCGPLSRAELARQSELAPPTLSRLIQQLLQHGLVRESIKVRDGQRGKPAQLVELNPHSGFALGIALQSEYLSGCIVDMDGTVCASHTLAVAVAPPERTRQLLDQILEALLDQSGITHSQLIGGGISMPGVALGAYGSGKPPAGKNDLPDEFDAWKNVDLGHFFSESLQLPCWLENSAKAATLAEMYYGQGRRLSNFAVLHFAYGFGGGLILDRRPYRGNHGHAAEFGGLFPYAGTRPSGRDLLLYLGEKMVHPPQQLRDIDAIPIPEHLLDGWAERVYPCLHDLCRWLAIALDLQAIILHGLIPEAAMQRLAELIRQRVPATLPAELSMPAISVSPLSANGLGMGAASLPLHHLTAPRP